MAKRVHIQYFALLRERAGRSFEDVETVSQTMGELYLERKALFEFPLEIEQVKASRNQLWVDMDQELSDGDRVVFIPPVAGG